MTESAHYARWGDLDNLSTEYEDLIKLAVEKVQGVTGMAVKAFDESEHPRDNDGKFTSGGGSGSNSGEDMAKEKGGSPTIGPNEVSDVRGSDSKTISGEIGDLYSHSLRDRKTNKVVKYAKVAPDVAELIKDATGLDVEGYDHTIDSFAIRHINSQHGDSKTEENRGQVAVTEEDIKRIPEIIANPDNIERGVTNQGKDAIVYSKRFNGTICYVEEVRAGRRNLAAETMYKKKAEALNGNS